MTAVLWPNGGTASPPRPGYASSGFRASSEFGMRPHPLTGGQTMHYGIDLIGFSKIKSPVLGVVSFAGYNGAAGNEVRVRADGPNAFIKGDSYRMLHNKTLLVKTGQRVTQGQEVAVMGSTGASNGDHCHFETRPGGGAAVEPRKYIASANAQAAGTPGTPITKEDKVIAYHRADATARGKGRSVAPGAGFYLHTTAGVATSQATNIVGGIGNYSITTHIYATGTPGDVLEAVLWWDNTKTTGPHSGHYVERVSIDKDGKLQASREFKRAVAAGFAVYFQVKAPSTNKGPVKVTVVDTDAYLFVSA